uniref:LysR family transcriptional regulator n=1 Tax=Gongylonema pulchrum TaxID=637853 RepID=A0A183DKD9_9BILA
LVHHYQKQYPALTLDVELELSKFKKHADRLNEMGLVGDTIEALDDMRRQGKSVLVEGANGAMLDIDFGII